jgi:hypothetical protein
MAASYYENTGEGGRKGAGKSALDMGTTALDYWTGDEQAAGHLTLDTAQKAAEGVTPPR